MAIDIAGQQILAQPVSSFLQGRAIRQAEQESGARMKALEAAEGREQEAFDMQKQDRQLKYDQINGQKTLARVQQVMALPRDQRKAYIAQNEPEFVSRIEQMRGESWDDVDDDEIEEMGSMILAKVSGDLGISPQQPEAYTLGKGEKRMVGNKIIAENTAPDEDEWTNPEPVMIGGRKVMAQVNKRTGDPRIVPGATPIEPAGDKGGDPFTKANVLRDEFNALTKDYGTVAASYNTIQSLAKEPSAAGDIGLLTSYMRMIDPGSTVREGEFATAENAGGVPDKITARYNNLLRGERLSDVQRADFVKQAGSMFTSRKEQYGKTRKTYRDLATRAEVNPLDVVGAEEQETSTPVPVESPITATGPGGQKLILKDGKWVPFNG